MMTRGVGRLRKMLVTATLVAVAVANIGALAQDPTLQVLTPTTTGAANDAEPVEAAVTVEGKKSVPEFVPTDEWQEILPGQGIPPGLHVRLNLATGKREAKFISDDEDDHATVSDPHVIERDVEVSVEERNGESVTVSTDLEGGIEAAAVISDVRGQGLISVGSENDEDTTPAETQSEPTDISNDEAPPAAEPNWNHEKIYDVLQALPEPPTIDGMDIQEAHAKLSQPEFRQQMIKLWKKRQEDLKAAIDSMQDDSKYLAKLLNQFRNAERAGDIEDQLRVLEVLEWEVQDLDKTHVFNFIGGFNVIAEYLNSTVLPVRARASWVVGTAVKNYKDGQDWAINSGAMPKLIESLTLPIPNEPILAEPVWEVKKKAIYALSSIVRFNERGQRLLLRLEGPSKLAALLDDQHPRSVKLKALLLVHDLLLEQSPNMDSADSLQQLQASFQSQPWCGHVVAFLNEQGVHLQRNQLIEILSAMTKQLPSCREHFDVANAKSVIASLRLKWSRDESLETEEREETLASVDALDTLL